MNPHILQVNNMAHPGFSQPPASSLTGLWWHASLPAFFLQQSTLALTRETLTIPENEEINKMQPISNNAKNFIIQI
ncbi:hypothetical protein [Mucilaginibacter hurinus]|nr:hypothetical protein [Mucilaginibacter hurinus]